MDRTSNPAGGGVGAENRLDFPEEMTKAGRCDGETDAIRRKKYMTYFSLYQKKRRKKMNVENGKNLPGFHL